MSKTGLPLLRQGNFKHGNGQVCERKRAGSEAAFAPPARFLLRFFSRYPSKMSREKEIDSCEGREEKKEILLPCRVLAIALFEFHKALLASFLDWRMISLFSHDFHDNQSDRSGPSNRTNKIKGHRCLG